jgi:hypothetical protein
MASPYRELPVEQLVQLDPLAVLAAWHEASLELAQLKIREGHLRLAAFQKNVAAPVEGTNNVPLEGGYLLKAIGKVNYKVEDTAEMRAALVALPGETPQRLLKWEPNLSVSEWKRLLDTDPVAAATVAPFITSKPGMPDLKIIAPGEAGNK